MSTMTGLRNEIFREVIDMKMSNKTYDILKKICLMLTPLVTFILAMTDVWGFAWGAELAATISAIGVFLGACIDISCRNYKPEEEE